MVEITIFLLAPRVKTTGNSVVDSSLFKPPATAHSFPTYENEVNLKTTQVRKGLWRNWKMLTLKTQEEVGKITHQSIDVDSRK
jgi:hypothetical protein